MNSKDTRLRLFSAAAAIVIIGVSCLICSCGEKPAPVSHGLVTARHGMVASGHYLATEAGLEVLREGGNAVDAAVTVGFTLAVTLPSAGNIGGGGFMLVHMAETGETVAIDYREKAPKAAFRDMFLDGNGNADPEKSQFSYWAVGVPGTVAGLSEALGRYGTISLERALRPAIELAEEGFAVDPYLQRSLANMKDRMAKSPASMEIFYKEDGEPYRVGETLVQKDLAWSLRQIAEYGPDAFYTGGIAAKIADDMEAHGGLITMEDLAAYRPAVREPVRGAFHGYEVHSMPPPSSGGVHVVQMLNILEEYPLRAWGHNSPKTIHVLAEAMKRAYADRAEYLGDTDFVPVPVEGLTSKRYAAELRDRISLDRATPSSEISHGLPGAYESPNTTHYSVMDGAGNAVSNTYTLNFSYRTGLTAAGTGIFLNNEMDDFSSKPGVPNAYGLLGNDFNAIEPEKRMLSCMTPTIVLDRDGAPFLVTGSPGGSRIITTVLQMVLNVLEFGMDPREATDAVRIHHQWMPDEIRVEPGLPPETKRALENMGHTVVERGSMGVTQTIMRRNGMLYGAADGRIGSSSAMGW